MLKQYFKIVDINNNQTLNNSTIDSQLSEAMHHDSSNKINSNINISSQFERLNINNKETFTHKELALVSKLLYATMH